jgi:type IV secretion system protein VirB10
MVTLILACLLAPAAEIPAGSHLLLRLINTVNTATAKPGDFVYMTTASPVSASGRILIPVGTHVQGVVAHAQRSGKVTGRAQLAIRIETLTLNSGQVFKFSPQLNSVDSGGTTQKADGKENTVTQGSDVGRDAARVAILAGSGASIGGIADNSWSGAGIGAGIGAGVGMATTLFTRGKEVELRSGSTLDVVFSRPVPLE